MMILCVLVFAYDRVCSKLCLYLHVYVFMYLCVPNSYSCLSVCICVFVCVAQRPHLDFSQTRSAEEKMSNTLLGLRE